MRAVLLAFALAACAQHPVETSETTTSLPANVAPRIRADLARLDQALSAPDIVAVGLGETADVGRGVRVHPIAVVEDSRCPQDVLCVWAGRLVIRASVAGAEQTLTLGGTTQTPSGDISLVVAKPGAWAGWSTDLPRPAYRFGFRKLTP